MFRDPNRIPDRLSLFSGKTQLYFLSYGGDTVRVIRILNEKQDVFQILFGISSISEEGENYWGD